eukprot:gb/GFBE01046294.1/.p1 GENE.gb/GFBE01046294.1/~~gb/GFBE01046294.1/.p1  ORF type:complete len:199 (+),score=40.10 gb/GFBE01046294.1/:1-597(+)
MSDAKEPASDAASAPGEYVAADEELSTSPGLELQGPPGIELWLHVYDLDATTANLNDWGLKSASLGLFHCGVEVLGQEYFFGWGETELSGIRTNRPRQHAVHSYRESIFMGKSPFSEEEIDRVVEETWSSWPELDYHPIRKNCTFFAEAFLKQLGASEPFPAWAHGAAEYGKAEFLRPVMDWGWEWAKYFAREPNSAT